MPGSTASRSWASWPAWWCAGCSRPSRPGAQRHRCDRWAATIGGILDACGLGRSFLANSEEAEAEMDQGLQDLAALAEYARRWRRRLLPARRAVMPIGSGKAAKEWIAAFSATQVLREQMLAGTDRSKATAIGRFLAARVDRSVRIDTTAGTRVATLRCREARANQKQRPDRWLEDARILA